MVVALVGLAAALFACVGVVVLFLMLVGKAGQEYYLPGKGRTRMLTVRLGFGRSYPLSAVQVALITAALFFTGLLL